MKTTRFYIDIAHNDDPEEIAEQLNMLLREYKSKAFVAPEGVPRTYICDGVVYAEQPWWTEILFVNQKVTSQEQISLDAAPLGVKARIQGLQVI